MVHGKEDEEERSENCYMCKCIPFHACDRRLETDVVNRTIVHWRGNLRLLEHADDERLHVVQKHHNDRDYHTSHQKTPDRVDERQREDVESDILPEDWVLQVKCFLIQVL